jgi:hypothetical protein
LFGVCAKYMPQENRKIGAADVLRTFRGRAGGVEKSAGWRRNIGRRDWNVRP